ncbi:TPA: hypothetical protein ACH3X3_009993 [Trebouxia sp. C0006]
MACLQMYPHGTGGTSLYNLRRSQHACRKSFIKRSRRRYANKRCLRCSPYTQAVHRGYLGETRTHMNTRYSSATVDQDKEDHRQNMRTVFDFERWATHRSSQRYLLHLIGIPKSMLIRGLKVPLLCEFCFSSCVASWEAYKEIHPSLGLPSSNLEASDPFHLTSFALALLLAFRLDASYSRYMEARSLWGDVVCDARNLMRQAQGCCENEESLQLLLRWTSAFCKVLMWHVREHCDLQSELKDVLLPSEVEALLQQEQHKPNFVLSVLTQIVHSMPAAEGQKLALDATLTKFQKAVATCERMVKTPIPRSYTRHTSRFLVIWLAFLPFTLWRACHWAMVPAAVLIAFLLLGVEEIGVQIEEPFGILPLGAPTGCLILWADFASFARRFRVQRRISCLKLT